MIFHWDINWPCIGTMIRLINLDLRQILNYFLIFILNLLWITMPGSDSRWDFIFPKFIDTHFEFFRINKNYFDFWIGLDITYIYLHDIRRLFFDFRVSNCVSLFLISFVDLLSFFFCFYLTFYLISIAKSRKLFKAGVCWNWEKIFCFYHVIIFIFVFLSNGGFSNVIIDFYIELYML